MAVYDLEEQEQIAELKAWWKSYGNTVLLLVIVTSLTISGYFGWRYYSDRQALEAPDDQRLQQVQVQLNLESKI